MTKKMCVIDIEANGFNPTEIFCMWLKEIDDGMTSLGTMRLFTSKPNFNLFDEYSTVIAHNGCGYDFPVLKKLWGMDLPLSKQVDTLIMSRLSRPDRKGGHSLAAWGDRLKFKKTEYSNGWDELTDEMLEYCKNDVLVCEKVYHQLLRELPYFSKESIRSEHRMQVLVNKVENAGFAFNLEKAYKFYSKLIKKQKDITFQMQDTFPDTEIKLKTKTKYVPFNPASRKQIGERLKERGWKPKEFTETGLPKIDENTLSRCDIPEAKVLAEYFVLQKRTGMLDSWIQNCGPDMRVHCKFHSLGAITNRMSSSGPNLQQIPSMRKPYGLECRELWIAEHGYQLLDTDAKSLELRVLAHYMNDPDYAKEVLEGDIHSTNQKMAGLPNRDAAKTFIYALCYGAGDAKLGTVVGGTASDGKELRERFLSNLPSFMRLREAVTNKGRTRGTVKGIDGRVLRVRHPHASLNTLIQGSSAVLMKNWFMNTDREMLAEGLDSKIVAMVHDELVIESAHNDVDRVSECVRISLQSVNKQFNLRCELDCDVILGNNWSEIH